MRVINPNATHAPSAKKTAVLAAIAALPSTQDSIDFTALRAGLGETVATLPDGTIHQICLDAGIKVTM